MSLDLSPSIPIAKKPFVKPTIEIDDVESVKTFEVIQENEDKKKRLARAGQSLKQSLIMNQRIRASNRAYDKFKLKELVDPNKKGTFRETYMPTFNI